MGPRAYSTAAESYIQAHEQTAISTVLCSPKVLEQFVDVVYVILKRTQLENIFSRNNNLHQNINFAMEEENNGKLVSVDTLIKRNNGNISVLLKRKPTDTDRHLHYSTYQQISCMESSIEHFP